MQKRVKKKYTCDPSVEEDVHDGGPFGGKVCWDGEEGDNQEEADHSKAALGVAEGAEEAGGLLFVVVECAVVDVVAVTITVGMSLPHSAIPFAAIARRSRPRLHAQSRLTRRTTRVHQNIHFRLRT